MGPARPQHRVQSAGARGPHHDVEAPDHARASWSAAVADDRAERDVDRGLQGPVQDARRRVLLSLDVDGFSRYLLGCQGVLSTAIEVARPIFLRLFHEYGLPSVMRTDNGVPFATTALGRLSTLSVWWIRLGILPELIAPGSPQQNGRHERMHRTLKAEATRPPSGNLPAQQRRFNRFRQEYNHDRPHEALDQETPASLYTPSSRTLPARLSPLEYPGHFETRLVSRNSGIRWKKQWVCVTHTLAGEYVGLEEVGDGPWDVYFGPVALGRMDERTCRIADHKGRTVRRASPADSASATVRE